MIRIWQGNLVSYISRFVGPEVALLHFEVHYPVWPDVPRPGRAPVVRRHVRLGLQLLPRRDVGTVQGQCRGRQRLVGDLMLRCLRVAVVGTTGLLARG